MKYFEVFKAGKYPQGKFSLSEVEELASNYDPSFCEAPITLDHEQKGPAYGWVEKLKADNGVLKATFKDLSEDLKEFVTQGKYKKISVEIYRELEGKKPYLKAVSFLGASIPQVKGMQSVEFKEGESEIYTFEVETKVEDKKPDTDDDSDTENVEELKATVSELEKQVADFKEKADCEQRLKGSEKSETVTPFSASNQEAKKNSEVKGLQKQVKDLTLQVAKFKNDANDKDEVMRELNALKSKIQEKEFEEFINKQIDAGVLTPANKDAVFNILQGLDNVKKFDESSNGVELFKSFLSTLPKQVEFDEIAKKKTTSKVNVEKYADADDESKEIFKEASELAEKENISFKDALLKIKEIN